MNDPSHAPGPHPSAQLACSADVQCLQAAAAAAAQRLGPGIARAGPREGGVVAQVQCQEGRVERPKAKAREEEACGRAALGACAGAGASNSTTCHPSNMQLQGVEVDRQQQATLN